jgi:2-dehydro-3-deoxygluconokinase
VDVSTQRVVALGELLLRLKSPQHERLLQSMTFSASFGGAEFNVLASLAGFGLATTLVSVLPDSPLGTAALSEIRRCGIDGTGVLMTPGRMGLCFLESGADQRPARILYDRADTAFARLQPAALDWSQLLTHAALLHVSSVTAEVGEGPYAAARVAVLSARQGGIQVSVDLSARGSSATEPVRERLKPIIAQATVLFAGAEDWSACLASPAPRDDARANARFDTFAAAVLAEYPQVKAVVSTLRETRSVDEQAITAACVPRGGALITTAPRTVRQVVEQIGSNDAFVAGFLYGRLQGWQWAAALEFGLAAAVLKHSIPGDVNRVSVEEVHELLGGRDPGRVQR